MAALRIYYDEKGKTLTVWFGDPNQEVVAEETGEEVILIKDRQGQVIGLERLNYLLAPGERLAVETVTAP